jgi:hypothetical protein
MLNCCAFSGPGFEKVQGGNGVKPGKRLESRVGTAFALQKTGLIDLFRPGSFSPPG